jgi:hypothetical protein
VLFGEGLDWRPVYNYGLVVVNFIDVEAGVRHPA